MGSEGEASTETKTRVKEERIGNGKGHKGKKGRCIVM